MDISKLYVGLIIKNYKELCAILGIPVKASTNSKQAQYKEMDRYFKYHKEGNKFIIDEIYLEVLPKIDNRIFNKGGANNVTEYTKYIENLILDLLVQGGNNKQGFGRVFLSKNQLFKEFNMINDNYVYCKRRILKLSKFMNINKETVEEWYDLNDDMLERNLQQALNSLENQSLISWHKELTVAEAIPMAQVTKDGTEIVKRKYIDQYNEEQIDYKYRADDEIQLNYREGTDKEKAFIKKIEKDTMNELGCDSKQKVIKLGMWETFKNKVDDIVLKELNIAFYYKSYKILFNEIHIKEAVDDIYGKCELTEEEKKDSKYLINNDVIDRTITNAENRHEKAVKEKSKIIGRMKNDKEGKRTKRRAEGNYIDDNIELGNSLIFINATNIKDSVKKTKLDVIGHAKSSKYMSLISNAQWTVIIHRKLLLMTK